MEQLMDHKGSLLSMIACIGKKKAGQPTMAHIAPSISLRETSKLAELSMI